MYAKDVDAFQSLQSNWQKLSLASFGNHETPFGTNLPDRMKLLTDHSLSPIEDGRFYMAFHILTRFQLFDTWKPTF